MKKKSLVFYGLLASMFLLDNCSNADDQLITPDQNALSSETTVLTPFGEIEKSKVRRIENGNALKFDGNSIIEFEISSDKVINRFAQPSPQPIGNGRTNTNNPGSNGNLIASRQINTSVSGLTYFSSTFSVPATPPPGNNETLFYGNKVAFNQGYLYSALQYGLSAAGGSGYWSVTNWFYDNAGNVSYMPLVTNLTPGTSLESVTSLSGGVWTSSFTGYANSYSVSGVTLQTNPFYNYFSGYPVSAKAYPSQYGVAFTNVLVKTGGTIPSNVLWLDAICSNCYNFGAGSTALYVVSPPYTYLDMISSTSPYCNPCENDLVYNYIIPPANVAFAQGGNFPISLTWSPTSGAQSYEIGYTIKEANGNLIHGIASSASTSYTFPFSAGQYCGNLLSAQVRSKYPGITTEWSAFGLTNPTSVMIGAQYTSNTTLTFQYSSGQFSVSSNYPIADQLTIGGSVKGYTGTTCSGGATDSDNFSTTLAPCSTGYSVITNGLSCLDKKYVFSPVTINGTTYTNGSTATINGHAYKIVIIASSCTAYPC
jgi:hypothetical protein